MTTIKAIELLAVITALLYVILASYENHWCWLFGIISPAIYLYLDLSANLFAEVILNCFYIVLGVYGWYQWRFKIFEKNNSKSISKANPRILFVLIACAFLISPVIGYLFEKINAAQSYFNSLLVVFSILATWLTTKKVIENWIFWIIIDSLYIVLYFNTNYYYTGILFAVYTLLAIWGYYQWHKRLTKTHG